MVLVQNALIKQSYGLTEREFLIMLAASNGTLGASFTDNLPFNGYRDNDVSTAISECFDDIINSDIEAVDEMAENLSYASTSHKWLDYLALLLGYTGYGFWNIKFTITQKQRLIKYAMQIWSRMGSSYSLITVLNCLDIPYKDYWELRGAFMAVNVQSDEYGGVVALNQADVNGTTLQRVTPFEGFVRMKVTLMRWDKLWKLAQTIVRYFSPAVTTIDVVYEEFIADMSLVDEPVFS